MTAEPAQTLQDSQRCLVHSWGGECQLEGSVVSVNRTADGSSRLSSACVRLGAKGDKENLILQHYAPFFVDMGAQSTALAVGCQLQCLRMHHKTDAGVGCHLYAQGRRRAQQNAALQSRLS